MEEKKMFLICVVWGIIGGIVARSFTPEILWVLFGAIAGGAGSYLTLEFREVMRAVERAWKQVAVIEWKPKLKKVAEAAFQAVVIIMIFVSILLPMVIVTLTAPEGSVKIESRLVLIVLGYSFGMFLTLFAIRYTFAHDKKIGRKDDSDVQLALRGLILLNPVVLYTYWPVRLLIAGTAWLVVKVLAYGPRAWKTTKIFLREVLLAIHSQKRTICGVSAALGVLVGYYITAEPIGTLIGGALAGLIGLVFHNVVAIKILHVVPNGNR